MVHVYHNLPHRFHPSPVRGIALIKWDKEVCREIDVPGVCFHAEPVPVTPPYCPLREIRLPVHIQMEAFAGGSAGVSEHQMP